MREVLSDRKKLILVCGRETFNTWFMFRRSLKAILFLACLHFVASHLFWRIALVAESGAEFARVGAALGTTAAQGPSFSQSLGQLTYQSLSFPMSLFLPKKKPRSVEHLIVPLHFQLLNSVLFATVSYLGIVLAALLIPRFGRSRLGRYALGVDEDIVPASVKDAASRGWVLIRQPLKKKAIPFLLFLCHLLSTQVALLFLVGQRIGRESHLFIDIVSAVLLFPTTPLLVDKDYWFRSGNAGLVLVLNSGFVTVLAMCVIELARTRRK